MVLILIFLILCIIGAVLAIKMQNKQKQALEVMYPNAIVVNANNSWLIKTGDKLYIVHNSVLKYKSKHVQINKVLECKIYEDGKEKSLGKAVVGGLTFGLVGALIGSQIKTEYITKLGLKLYTDKGNFDINFLNLKTKKDSMVYKASCDEVDKAYNLILNYME